MRVWFQCAKVVSARRVVSTFVCAFLFAACDNGVTTIPAPPVSVPRVSLDVAYASVAQAQKLDIYLPETGTGPYPVVVWIHGGGWSGGSKALDAASVQRQLTTRGYAVASVEYRLSGVARYPAAVQDVKAAIRFLRANATKYSLRGDRIAAWGNSAGGHLAAMLALSGGASVFDDAALGNATESSRVQALVDWFGPSDLLMMDADGATQGCPVYNGTGHDAAGSPEGIFLGSRPSLAPAKAREASPMTWVTADDPPALIEHGGRDCTVPTGQGKRLRDAMRAVMDTSRVAWAELPNDGHGGVGFEAAANMNLVAAFLDKYLK
jgi:acetyl esterase/lipase